MKIMKKWRKTLKYSSYDGMSVFQCLNCKDYFDNGSSPFGEKQYDGTYSNYGYKFCPYCGIQWDGELDWGCWDVKYFDVNDIRKQKPDIIWNIQEATVWKQNDGSYKSLNGHRNELIDGINWNSKEFLVNWTAHEVKKHVDYLKEYYNYDKEKDYFSDIRNLIRVVVVKQQNDYDSIRYNYNNRCKKYDFDYHKDYQNKYGGKLHYSNNERRWMKP